MTSALASQWMRTYQRLLALRARDLTADTAGRSAIVLAPHPDDETLGCGATIARKRAAGTQVAVVFATDGGHSHAGRIRPEELARRRRAEGLRACGELGVPESHVFFLGFEDGSLGEHLPDAATAVARLIDRLSPDELFVCTALDRHPDHVALRQVVQLLAERGSLPPRVYEYPVWFWAARAWRQRRAGGRLYEARAALFAQARALAFLQVRLVRAHPFLQNKRTALQQHASQVAVPSQESSWPTLPGSLVERCFAPYELFFEQQLAPPVPDASQATRARNAERQEPPARHNPAERPKTTEPPVLA